VTAFVPAVSLAAAGKPANPETSGIVKS
jgi:hypothetical protein